MKNELTKEEEVFYGNFGLIEDCALCGNPMPIHKYDPYHERDNDNYVEFNGKSFICQKCLN